MTDLLENIIECAAGEGIINKGLAVAQKSEFSWLMMLKRVWFFFFFFLSASVLFILGQLK